jgi:hypothetical protein
MNLNKYYGHVYVSADNVKSKYDFLKVSEPNEITSVPRRLFIPALQ